MTKKTRSKRMRSATPRAAVVENTKSGLKPMAVEKLPDRKSVTKQHAGEADFTRKYEYIGKDLRRILLIAVPMLLVIIILSFFIN